MLPVTTLLARTNASVIQVGQVMDKTVLISTSVRLDCTRASRIHTAQTPKVVIRVPVIKDGGASGLNHTADVLDVTQARFVLDMDNACEMAHAIV